MDKKKILWKSIVISLIGLPMSYLINVAVLPFLSQMIIDNVYLAGFILTIPFIIASILRLWIIDYCFQKYNVDLNPLHLIKKLSRSDLTKRMTNVNHE